MTLRATMTQLELQRDVEFGSVSDVDVDENGSIFLLTREPSAVVRYDAAGAYLGHWGLGAFVHPHGLTVDRGTVYVVDQYAHCVRIFTTEGREIAAIGQGAGASDTGFDWNRPNYEERYLTIERGGKPFNNPTKAAVGHDGSIFVSDGYGNARVHLFGPDRRWCLSWGEPGSGAGEFRLPHSVCVTGSGVFVADRENDRVQCFDSTGNFVGAWTDVQRPTAVVALGADGFLVAELARRAGERSFVHGVAQRDQPARVSLIDAAGRAVDRLVLAGAPELDGLAVRPHGLSTPFAGRAWIANLGGGHHDPLVSVSWL